MNEGTVVILGAGATAACGGPLTNDFLPLIFGTSTPLPRFRKFGNKPLLRQINLPEDSIGRMFLQAADEFLVPTFEIPSSPAKRRAIDYPPLPLLMGLIDTALDKHEALSPSQDAFAIAKVRKGIELGIHAVLDRLARRLDLGLHRRLFRFLFPAPVTPKVISFNYDTIAESALSDHLKDEYRCENRKPDYGCDLIRAGGAVAAPFSTHGLVLKPHGSVNWKYCPLCHRLRMFRTLLGAMRKHPPTPAEVCRVEDLYAHQAKCEACGANYEPLMVMPTYLKDYRNPHLASIWHKADAMIRGARELIFIGYSLPESDVNVLYLILKAAAHLKARHITVVEHDRDHRSKFVNPVGKRYVALFGDDIKWFPGGLAAWLESRGSTRSKTIDGRGPALQPAAVHPVGPRGRVSAVARNVKAR